MIYIINREKGLHYYPLFKEKQIPDQSVWDLYIVNLVMALSEGLVFIFRSFACLA